MHSSALLDLILGLAVVAYLCLKQLSWRPVDPARMWRMALILGVAGVASMARQAAPIHPADVAVLALSALSALASGALMGRIARFRPSPADPARVESRTGAAGVAIWVVLVAIRVGLDLAGHALGSDLAVSTGSILLVLAFNRAANTFVVSARQPRRVPALAGR